MNKEYLIQEILESFNSIIPLSHDFEETEETDTLEMIEMELESILNSITLLKEKMNEQD